MKMDEVEGVQSPAKLFELKNVVNEWVEIGFIEAQRLRTNGYEFGGGFRITARE